MRNRFDLEDTVENSHLFGEETGSITPVKKGKCTLRSYAQAENVLRNFSLDERYLRSLVAEYFGAEYADSIRNDRTALKHEGYILRGVARRMLRTLIDR